MASIKVTKTEKSRQRVKIRYITKCQNCGKFAIGGSSKGNNGALSKGKKKK